MPGKQYTDKQKAAYYKKKAAAGSVRRPAAKRSSAGSYFKRNYNKPYKYKGAGEAIGRTLGALGSTYAGFGPSIGSSIGGVAGRGAHSLIKTITGFGDYNVSKNSLVYNRDSIPEFTHANPRCTMITHREFIQDISGSVDFAKNEFRINPSIDTTFPWLAAVAQNYEQYVVQGMVFEFKTTSATAIGSTNTALGTVIMATQYNSLAAEFQTKQQMENYEFSMSSIPSASMLHPIECDPAQTQCGGIFNIANPSDGSGDRRLYDMGRFTIATVGMQAPAVIGELWVTYKICFLKPKLRASDEDALLLYQSVPSSIATGSPFGDVDGWLPAQADWDSNLIIPTTSADLTIRPGFVGILAINIHWDCTNAVTAAHTAQDVATTGCENVTALVFQQTQDQLVVYPDLVGGNGCMYQLLYVKCLGEPIMSIFLDNFLITGGGCNVVTIQAVSLPDSFIDYPFI